MHKLQLKKFLSSNCTKLVFGISLLYSSSLIVNAYGLPVVTKHGALLKNTRSANGFSLTAVANPQNNNVSLNWSLNNNYNKTFKVYKKRDGNTIFQSISTTNFESVEQVKVLNVYPNVGNHLKKWMEQSTSYTDTNGKRIDVPNGYGKNIIKVDEVSINDFNANPERYLKNSDGSFKYHVIMFGTWDANNYFDITLNARNIVEEFIVSGRGVLFGHDTVCSNNYWTNFTYLGKKYLNMVNSGTNSATYSSITVSKKGLLTNYPWVVGDLGTKLSIPSTHSYGQAAYGDIWMNYTGASQSSNNFYLTTWNNVAMIQTGHSNASATPDEQKLLANTLFYLNQLSTSTSLVDNDGQDVTAPELPKLKFASSNTTSATYSIESINDIGTNYQYYVTAEDKNGSISQSNTVSTTVTSGLKGYSYVIDNSPNTEPNNTVNLNTTTKNINVNIADTNKEYYIHIKSIDNRNNASKTVHIKIDAPKLTATANNQQNNVSLNWSLVDKTNKIFKVYKKTDNNQTFQSISTTNFEGIEQVKVLNVYPNVGNNLKKWMEQPTSYTDKNGQRVNVPNGYGKNIIKVDEVSISNFNANPASYLKNSDGSFKYHVIMFGTWDANNSLDINVNARNVVEEFIVSGRGVLFGHDTVCSNNKWGNFTYLGKKYLNMDNAGADTSRYSSITVAKKGLLTNYPWLVGDLGSTLSIPSTHTYGQAAYGDIWMSYTGANKSSSNFYLTTWNNVAMIQTGHSNASATPDEQKLLANTLFYLNQLSTGTSLVDNDGQDVTAPELPKLTCSSANINSATYSIEEIQDIGTNYEYYVIAEDKNGNTFKSNTVATTVTSGLKGYSYVIDNSPKTEPSNEVNLTTSNKNINVNIADTNKEYYIHIKAIDNVNNASNTVHIQVNSLKLTATANNEQNNVSLQWSLPNETNTIYKAYKKNEGSNTFQSISATNFSSTKQVRVLNIHPGVGAIEFFSTWDGETVALPKSAALKRWMEEPNSAHPKGYGKGIIEVTPITQAEFNENPYYYLKDKDGNWNYDVIYQGHWDVNNNQIPNDAALNAYIEFINDGCGFLAGHDTIGWDLGTNVGLSRLRHLFNIKVGYWDNASIPTDEGHNYSAGFSSNQIFIQKKGLLTNYPWSIGDIGSSLTIPPTHSTSNFAYGDIWLTFPTGSLWSGIQNPSHLQNVNNFYLTTWNNTAMIQTGHSNGAATPDEQKILANTLFYLNQMSSDTSLTDYSGQDVKAPDAPAVNLLSPTSTSFNFDFSETQDNGSTYEYYVVAEDKLGNKLQSNTASATVTTGIKGYSYVLDTNPTTEPSNTINLTSNNLTINNLNNNTTYYLHIKAIDNANNVSKTTHFKISIAAPIAPVLNLSRTGWGSTDARFTITQNHNKNVKILSISTASNTPLVNRLKALGYNITSNPNLTNIDEIKKYDIVISDYYCWTVANGAFLEKLYNNGVKLITVGNDTGNSILPILATKSVGSEANLTIGRNIKNEATFAVPSYNPGIDSSSAVITKAIASSTTWYTTTSFNAPSILSMQNGKGGEWIHSQCLLGGNGTDELIMGFIDYLTHSISQVHIQDVQYKINDGNWTSYNGEAIVLSNEGNYNISVRNIDTRGVASVVDTQTVGIDKTAPKGIVYTNKTTTSRKINVTLDSLEDKLSGLNKVRISNYSDFRDSTGYTSISNKTSIDLKIELPFISKVEENYSTRTIYIEIQDKVGNKKVLTCSTNYEPKNPTVTITSPTNNKFFAANESVTISWDYNGNNNDNVVLPQSKAVVTATNVDNNSAPTLTTTVTGTANTAVLPKLETGEYSITVTVYNSFEKHAVSEPIKIRCNVFSATGNLNTVSISVGSPLKFISVFSDVEIPSGTEIKGYIYYAENISDSFDENNKLEFTIASNKVSSDIIKLPKTSIKIKVHYELYNKTTNKQLSPALCRIMVLGK